MDINSIQLADEDGMVGWGDVMQIADPLGAPLANYFYYDKSMHPSGAATENYWGDEGFDPVEVSFDKGESVAIDNPNEYEYRISNAGEVIHEDVRFAAAENLNWIGNPFPSAININAIQLADEDGLVGWGDVMQIADPLGAPLANYFYYDKSMHPSGTATENYWGDEGFEPVEITLQPGDGFAIDNPNGYVYDIIIKCPYSL